jgi:crotonobetainyl-CoA:carnitine CoA-transferase CaiB-like acyl-CoA transferase
MNNNFIRGYADLTGFTVGNFVVDSLAGNDRERRPLWQAICKRCRVAQTFEHRQLSVALESGKPEETLFCQSGRCPNSRKTSAEEVSLFELRRQEREERQRIAQQTAEAQTRVERETAAATARDAAVAPLKTEWSVYKNHQLNAGTSISEIAGLERWLALGPAMRERIMVAIRKDPNVKVTRLKR